jgi:hypothetical protein
MAQKEGKCGTATISYDEACTWICPKTTLRLVGNMSEKRRRDHYLWRRARDKWTYASYSDHRRQPKGGRGLSLQEVGSPRQCPVEVGQKKSPTHPLGHEEIAHALGLQLVAKK